MDVIISMNGLMSGCRNGTVLKILSIFINSTYVYTRFLGNYKYSMYLDYDLKV